MASRRRAPSVTGSRSALARHVGPPGRRVPPAPVAAPAVESQMQPASEAQPEPVTARERVSALGAITGAALALCGVVLGISALLLAQPAPQEPTEPTGISSAEQGAGAVATDGTEASAAATTGPSAIASTSKL